jgi:hypothetical protein
MFRPPNTLTYKSPALADGAAATSAQAVVAARIDLSFISVVS